MTRGRANCAPWHRFTPKPIHSNCQCSSMSQVEVIGSLKVKQPFYPAAQIMPSYGLHSRAL